MKPADWTAADERDAEREWVSEQQTRLMELELEIAECERRQDTYPPSLYDGIERRRRKAQQERSRIEHELRGEAE